MITNGWNCTEDASTGTVRLNPDFVPTALNRLHDSIRGMELWGFELELQPLPAPKDNNASHSVPLAMCKHTMHHYPLRRFLHSLFGRTPLAMTGKFYYNHWGSLQYYGLAIWKREGFGQGDGMEGWYAILMDRVWVPGMMPVLQVSVNGRLFLLAFNWVFDAVVAQNCPAR